MTYGQRVLKERLVSSSVIFVVVDVVVVWGREIYFVWHGMAVIHFPLHSHV